MIRSGAVFVVLLLLPAWGKPADGPHVSGAVEPNDQPDPRKAPTVWLSPDQKDLDRLKSVEGKPKWQVLRVLGHPTKVGRDKNGQDVWTYPWGACCEVWIGKDGVCVRTFYIGGY